jgi:hypothetical protein
MGVLPLPAQDEHEQRDRCEDQDERHQRVVGHEGTVTSPWLVRATAKSSAVM